MKRAVLYLRVSTIDQTTANQERELREIARRMGCEIVKIYKDHGISGAKGRDKRPAFDALCRDATKRQFDMVMAWSVDRLGRSLQDLVPSVVLRRRARDGGTGWDPLAGWLSSCKSRRLLDISQRIRLHAGCRSTEAYGR